MQIESTRLRFVSAVDPLMISGWVDRLTFKIEIKGSPIFDGNKWFLWFILPENDGVKLDNIDLELT